MIVIGHDAVLIGAGHIGPVGADMLAHEGWSVWVLEAQPRACGAVFCDRSLPAECITDWYSAYYPLGVASPVLDEPDLGRYRLAWRHAPTVLARCWLKPARAIRRCSSQPPHVFIGYGQSKGATVRPYLAQRLVVAASRWWPVSAVGEGPSRFLRLDSFSGSAVQGLTAWSA